MLAASLVVYRVVYYLLPLLVATLVAMFIDLRIKKTTVPVVNDAS
jgi:hypothetical protein